MTICTALSVCYGLPMPTSAEPKKRGRPRKDASTDGENLSPSVSVRFPPEIHRRMILAQRETGLTTLSQLVRVAVATFIETPEYLVIASEMSLELAGMRKALYARMLKRLQEVSDEELDKYIQAYVNSVSGD